MVEKINSEIKEIEKCLNNERSFVLQGGAGSGKTYTLVETIKKALEIKPKSKIACITYTNIAADEIKSRISSSNLHVSTIHDFIWSNIKKFQKNLKIVLLDIIRYKKIKVNDESIFTENYFLDKDITYKEWEKISDGVISHDTLLLLAEELFKRYNLLSKIIVDKYDFIFIDEYQDTNDKVMNIIFECILKTDKKNIIGFFGDPMQSIYEDGDDYLDKYIKSQAIEQIIKQDNRRNPEVIIELANKLRSGIDEVWQKQADDETAPNYRKKGSIKFLYSYGDLDIKHIKQSEFLKDWDFNDCKNVKELYLTKRIIAKACDFDEIFDIYANDEIIKCVNEIKKYTKENNISIDENCTFGEVIELNEIKASKLITKNMNEFFEKNNNLFEEAKLFKWSELKDIYLNTEQLIGKKKNSDDEKIKGSAIDSIIEHLFRIEELIYYYKIGKYNEFIRATDLKINTIQNKRDLANNIEKLSKIKDSTIEEMINRADEFRICKKDDKIDIFIKEKRYLYNRLKDIKYSNIKYLYKYVENYTPFSTQHNVKGAEFKKVFIYLDNAKWRKYNFEYLFTDLESNKVSQRTRKLFYVCCTRAMS